MLFVQNVEYLFASGIANQLGVSALFVTRITGTFFHISFANDCEL